MLQEGSSTERPSSEIQYFYWLLVPQLGGDSHREEGCQKPADIAIVTNFEMDNFDIHDQDINVRVPST